MEYTEWNTLEKQNKVNLVVEKALHVILLQEESAFVRGYYSIRCRLDDKDLWQFCGNLQPTYFTFRGLFVYLMIILWLIL